MAPGHTLVIPKKEVDYIFKLDDQELVELNIFAKRVAKAMEKAMPCKRIGVTVIGLEVPHAHIHLIPINQESDMYFNKGKLTMDPKDLADIAASIAREFE